MSDIIVIGGTGYAGTAIAQEAHQREHQVTVICRTPPTDPLTGVSYLPGDAEQALNVIQHADVLVGAISSRDSEPGAVPNTYHAIIAAAERLNTRLIVVGGFGSLRPAPGAPRFAEGDKMPPQIAAISREMLEVLHSLQATPPTVDWVYISPAQQFGAHRIQGPSRGGYRLGDEVALLTGDGTSEIEGSDFALAVVDEIDNAAHHRAHLGVAY